MLAINTLTFGTSSGFLSSNRERMRTFKDEPLCCTKEEQIQESIRSWFERRQKSWGTKKKRTPKLCQNSLPTILLDSCSVNTPFEDFAFNDEVLEREFVNGSEFFRTNCLADVVGFTFPPNFQIPLLPLCFHSLYDFSAKTQLTILEDFPPWKLSMSVNLAKWVSRWNDLRWN